LRDHVRLPSSDAREKAGTRGGKEKVRGKEKGKEDTHCATLIGFIGICSSRKRNFSSTVCLGKRDRREATRRGLTHSPSAATKVLFKAFFETAELREEREEEKRDRG